MLIHNKQINLQLVTHCLMTVVYMQAYYFMCKNKDYH